MKVTLTSILALFGVGCAEKTESKVQNVNLAELQKGPVQRENLSDEQLKRIDKIREILAEVDNQSKEEWIDNFKRDLNPDKEIEIWEQMAKIFQSYCSKNNLSKEAKGEVLQIVLLRSMAINEDEILKSANLKNLTKEQVKEIISLH